MYLLETAKGCGRKGSRGWLGGSGRWKVDKRGRMRSWVTASDLENYAQVFLTFFHVI